MTRSCCARSSRQRQSLREPPSLRPSIASSKTHTACITGRTVFRRLGMGKKSLAMSLGFNVNALHDQLFLVLGIDPFPPLPTLRSRVLMQIMGTEAQPRTVREKLTPIRPPSLFLPLRHQRPSPWQPSCACVLGSKAFCRVQFAGVTLPVPPLSLSLPVSVPFGEFEVLQHDREMRVIR